MNSKQRVLIIGTETAVDGRESGASLRLRFIEKLLLDDGCSITISSRSSANQFLREEWDLIVLISYSTAKFLNKARKQTPNLWFDPTDSWTNSRLSLIRKGLFQHILLLARDFFWLSRAPEMEMLTFITMADAMAQKRWWRKRISPLILPITGLKRQIMKSTPSRLVFVGDGNYGPNVQALNFLTNVLNCLPVNTKIHVFGKDFEPKDKRFVVEGYVDNSQLYRVSDIHLAPINTGSGLKLKVAVPLWNGLRVIATPSASSGFVQVPNLNIESKPIQFAECISILQKQEYAIETNPGDAIFLNNDLEKVQGWLRQISENT